MKISNDEIELLQLFNSKAVLVINSEFKDKSKNKGVGETLNWKLNESTNKLDFSYSVTNHNSNYINSVLIPLRLFVQDDPISLKNIAKIYENNILDIDFRDRFKQLRKKINEYFDEPAKTLLDDKPSKEQLFRTILNGDVFHVSKNERERLEQWKSNKTVWNLAYVEYQRIIHDYIDGVEAIKNLNEEVLAKHS